MPIMPPRTPQRMLPGLEPDPAPDEPSKKGVRGSGKSKTAPDSVTDAGTASVPVAYPEPAPVDPASLRGKTVYAVDTMSLLFQVFHAIPEMTSPQGESVGAVYGFVRDILFLIEQQHPDFLF